MGKGDVVKCTMRIGGTNFSERRRENLLEAKGHVQNPTNQIQEVI